MRRTGMTGVWKSHSFSRFFSFPELFFLLCAAVLPPFFHACSPERGGKTENPEPESFIRKTYPNLVLEVVSPRAEYYAGEEDQSITFRLQNQDLKPVRIHDWKMNETDNLILYRAFLEEGASAESLPDSAWVQVWPVVRAGEEGASREKGQSSALHALQQRRTPLLLNPDTATLITIPMTFLKDVKLSHPGERLRFALRGELNLNTLEQKSGIFEITVK